MGSRNELPEWVGRRNEWLVKFFGQFQLPFEVKIFDPSKPMVMLGSTVCNCYVHNFELRFTDQVRGGNLLKTVKLTDNAQMDDDGFLYKWLNDYKHRLTYRIQFAGENLWLSGYNFLDRENGKGRYPVFAPNNPKIYFKQEYAQEICDEYNDLFEGKLNVV